MKVSDAFPRNFLGHENIPDGADLILTISKVGIEEVGQEKEKKLVARFKEVEQGLVLNKTNAETIEKVLGSNETDDWIGKKVALYATEVTFQGKVSMGVRVRLRAPAGA